VAVTPTITTLDRSLSLIVEPGAPLPSKRINALRKAAENDVPIGVRVDPIIPLVNDDPFELKELIGVLAEAGARFIVTSTYKARPDNLARLVRALSSSIASRLVKMYKNGVKIQGYSYLPRKMREKLLYPIIEAARYYGLEYATCREGLSGPEWWNTGSCDGTHLIPLRVPPKRVSDNVTRWINS
jgi:DNA repair photolyase